MKTSLLIAFPPFSKAPSSNRPKSLLTPFLMESLQILPKPSHPSFLMNSISTKLRCIGYSKLRTFYASSIDLKNTHQLINGGKRKKRVGVKVSEAQLKESWLNSLTCPVPEKEEDLNGVGKSRDSGLEWVIGIDPDLSGALALLKSDEVGCSAEVFDSPILQVMVGNRVRKRLDAKSIVQMLRSFDAPLGTVAYIEQSTPFPKDGKQGWWGGGFGYGMWIGILVASGYSVVPVSSMLWKNHFKLSGSQLTKDDSRKAAGTLFPHLSSQLKRKKDHGRAEALLIAAYGKGLQIKSEPSLIDA